MNAKEKIQEAQTLLREAYGAIQGDSFDNSLTRRILHFLNLPPCEEERRPGRGPIYVPEAWEKEAEKYHQRECATCRRVPPVACSICGDPIIVGGVCENCIPNESAVSLAEYKKRRDKEIDDILKE